MVRVAAVCKAENLQHLTELGADYLHRSDNSIVWYKSSNLKQIDVLLDPIGDKAAVEMGRLLLNVPTGIIVNAAQPIELIHSGQQQQQQLSFILNNLLVSNTDHQDLIAEYVINGEIKCPISGYHDFSVEGVQALFAAQENSFGKQIVRIVPSAYYSFISLEAASKALTEESRIALINYGLATQRMPNNIYCDVQRVKSSRTENENWIVVQLWRDLSSLQAHLSSSEHKINISKWEAFGFTIKFNRIFRDFMDDQAAPRKVRAALQKSSFQRSVYRFYLMMEYPHEAEATVMFMLRESKTRVQSISNCIYLGGGKMLTDENEESNSKSTTHLYTFVFADEIAFMQYRNRNDTQSSLSKYHAITTQKPLMFFPHADQPSFFFIQ